MELDPRKKSRRDRMMRSKSFDTQEVREIGWKEVGEPRVGRECSISRQRARLYSGGIHVGGVRGGSHSVTAGGQLQQ